MKNALFVFLNMILILFFISCVANLKINSQHIIVRKDRIEWASAVHLIIIDDVYYYKECKNPDKCTDKENKMYRSGGSGSGFAVKV